MRSRASGRELRALERGLQRRDHVELAPPRDRRAPRQVAGAQLDRRPGQRADDRRGVAGVGQHRAARRARRGPRDAGRSAPSPAKRNGTLRSSNAAATSRASRQPPPAITQMPSGRTSPEASSCSTSRATACAWARSPLARQKRTEPSPSREATGSSPASAAAAAASEPPKRRVPGSSISVASGSPRETRRGRSGPSRARRRTPWLGSQAAVTFRCAAERRDQAAMRRAGCPRARRRERTGSARQGRRARRPGREQQAPQLQRRGRPRRCRCAPAGCGRARAKKSANSTSRCAALALGRSGGGIAGDPRPTRAAAPGRMPSPFRTSIRPSSRARRPAGLPRISWRRRGRSSRRSSMIASRSAGQTWRRTGRGRPPARTRKQPLGDLLVGPDPQLLVRRGR